MGMIVKGYEMPDCCEDCDYYIGDYPLPICNILDQNIVNVDNEKSKYCPLRTVDGLIEQIAKAAHNNPSLGEDKKDIPFNQGLIATIEIIKEYCE